MEFHVCCAVRCVCDENYFFFLSKLTHGMCVLVVVEVVKWSGVQGRMKGIGIENRCI